MASGTLPTTNTPNGGGVPSAVNPINPASLGAAQNFGTAQNNVQREFELVGNPTDGNQVDIYSSQTGVAGTFVFVCRLNGGDRLTPDTIAQYYLTVRQLGTVAVVVQWGDAVGSGAGVNSITNGGQTGAVLVGSTNSTTTIGFASGTGTSVVGSTANGLGLGVAAPGVNGTVVDSQAGGMVAVGTTNAISVAIGSPASAVAALTLGVAAGGTIGIGTGAAAATVNVGTGAAAITTTVGSTNTTSTTRVQFGSGGLGIGVAAPGGSGVTLDTPVAGAVLIGNTNATSLTIGGGALATIGIGSPSLATAITIGNITGNSSVAVFVGTGALNLSGGATDHVTTLGSVTGASPTSVRAGTGALNIIRNGITWVWPNADGVAAAIGGGSVMLSNGGGTLSFTQIQSGTGTLASGTLTISANITANSRIMVTPNTPKALTVVFDAPSASRVVGVSGGSGGFVVNGLVAAGTLASTDSTSTFDWFVFG